MGLDNISWLLPDPQEVLSFPEYLRRTCKKGTTSVTWGLIVGVLGFVALFIWRSLLKRIANHGTTVALSWLKTASYAAALFLVGVLVLAQVRNFSDGFDGRAILNGILIAFAQVAVLFYWFIFPGARWMRQKSGRRLPSSERR